MENSLEGPQETKNKVVMLLLLLSPVIPLLGILLDKTIVEKDTFTPTFTLYNSGDMETT